MKLSRKVKIKFSLLQKFSILTSKSIYLEPGVNFLTFSTCIFLEDKLKFCSSLNFESCLRKFDRLWGRNIDVNFLGYSYFHVKSNGLRNRSTNRKALLDYIVPIKSKFIVRKTFSIK
jgi:hypothetical protein